LTSKEFALLELFMLHPGKVISRIAIAERVWDEEFDPHSNIIDVYINRLRKRSTMVLRTISCIPAATRGIFSRVY